MEGERLVTTTLVGSPGMVGGVVITSGLEAAPSPPVDFAVIVNLYSVLGFNPVNEKTPGVVVDVTNVRSAYKL